MVYFSKFIKFIFQKKKTLILVLGLGLFLSLIPLYSAQAANWWDFPGQIFNYLVTLPLRTTALLVAIPLAIIAMVTGVLYTIVIVSLGWLKVIALSVPVIPSKVGVVQAGWEITHNLANMGFILILVFIGLATILKIKEYEAKKLLPVLIIVALLINFSPVIVGFIVDISNIITNFFLNLGTWETTITIWEMIGNYFADAFSIMTELGDVWEIVGSIIGTLVLGAVLTCFFAYSAWIYLLVAVLLVVRIIILWILMILAPLAFLFYVLPAGRKLAREWWQQLVQWAILAIPLGFFLFLSFKVLEYTTQVKGFFQADTLKGDVGSVELGGDLDFGNFTGQLAEVLGVILVPLVSIVMLHIGYKLSRRYMPAAANQIIGGIEKGFKMAAGAAVVAATGGAAAGLAAKGLAGAARGAQRMEAAAAKLPGGKVWSKPFTKPISWATRGTERAIAPQLLEYAAKTRKLPDKEIEKIDKMTGPEAEAYVNAKTGTLPAGLKSRQKLQYMARMADKETLEQTSQAFQDEAKATRRDVFVSENPHLQKEAASIAKSLGDVSEEELVHSKLVGMPSKTTNDKMARKDKENEIREDVEKTKNIIQSRIGEDDFIVEVGLKLKYITKEEVDTDKPAALAKARIKITEQDLKNVAAEATYVKDFKPNDIKKMINPDTLAARVGISLGSPKNLQRIQDNFGNKKLRGVIEGKGGLNDAMSSPKKLEEFYRVNSQMVKAIFTSPAYRELDIEGRKHMPPKKGRPNLRAFLEKMDREKGTPEELAKEAVKGALEEIRKEKRVAAPPSVSQLENRVNELKINIEKMGNEYKSLRKAKPPGFKERAEGLRSHITELKKELREVGNTIRQAKKVSGKKKPEKTS